MSDIATLRRVLAGYRPGTQITINDLHDILVNTAQVKPLALGPLLREGCRKGLLYWDGFSTRKSADPIARGRRILVYSVVAQSVDVAA
jgi:hypothetical protein